MPLYVVSACLAGIACRYNAQHALCLPVQNLVSQGMALPICPEVLAKLPTPRNPVELRENKVYDFAGIEYTDAFLLGARQALDLCLDAGCTKAILKTCSPSCGRDFVYDGTFSGTLIKGQGLWAKLLHEHNIMLFTENDLPPDIYT